MLTPIIINKYKKLNWEGVLTRLVCGQDDPPHPTNPEQNPSSPLFCWWMDWKQLTPKEG